MEEEEEGQREGAVGSGIGGSEDSEESDKGF